MKLKIIWSQFAENQIDEFYDYYLQKAGTRIAKKKLSKK
ncbi:hypothetical protein SAMN05444481_10884 [Flavobacterium frigidimaris]|jgi:toxin ParE1/3/4|nr:hypothetical protein SAMN05444481_10884 [Flavobacterium frigidimaris]